jgi:capsule polysaccharide export protein KpsE/RkpR
LNQVLAAVNTSSAHRERVFIDERLAEVKKDLDTSAKDFSEFASANSAIDIPEQAKAMVGAAAELEAKMIAAQSMLNGLRQIYTENNANVRQMEASVNELQRQINLFGGRDVAVTGGATLPKGELYPSVRQLPLLGVRYMELFRRTKVNEAVYEFLIKQGEIARVQEARDVPKVQVLDAAVVPQKKTSPHRSLIILFGTCFSLLTGISWFTGDAYWHRVDPRKPWKMFLQELFLRCKGQTWNSMAGVAIRSRLQAVTGKIASWRKRGHEEIPGPSN